MCFLVCVCMCVCVCVLLHRVGIERKQNKSDENALKQQQCI